MIRQLSWAIIGKLADVVDDRRHGSAVQPIRNDRRSPPVPSLHGCTPAEDLPVQPATHYSRLMSHVPGAVLTHFGPHIQDGRRAAPLLLQQTRDVGATSFALHDPRIAQDGPRCRVHCTTPPDARVRMPSLTLYGGGRRRKVLLRDANAQSPGQDHRPRATSDTAKAKRAASPRPPPAGGSCAPPPGVGDARWGVCDRPSNAPPAATAPPRSLPGLPSWPQAPGPACASAESGKSPGRPRGVIGSHRAKETNPTTGGGRQRAEYRRPPALPAGRAPAASPLGRLKLFKGCQAGSQQAASAGLATCTRRSCGPLRPARCGCEE